MKKKIIVFIIIISIFLNIFSACNKKDKIDNMDFAAINISSIYQSNIFKIVCANNLILYLPIVTNKEINDVKMGSYGRHSYQKDSTSIVDDLIIEFQIAENQDQLNCLYNDYYISFIKILINFEITNNLNDFQKFEFDEMDIFVLNGNKEIKIEYFYKYLEIEIVDSNPISIDWNITNSLMKDKIKQMLNYN